MTSSLRDQLSKGKWGGHFYQDFAAGAPVRQSDRRRVFLDIFDSIRNRIQLERKDLGAEEAEQLAAMQMGETLDGMLRDVAGKTVELLQVLSVIAAVMAFIGIDRRFDLLIQQGAQLSIPLVFFTVAMLFPNIGFLSWRRPQSFYSNPSVRVLELYGLLIARAHRLRVGQVLTMAIIMLVFFVSGALLMGPDAANAFLHGHASGLFSR